jgi:hypothetical protein
MSFFFLKFTCYLQITQIIKKERSCPESVDGGRIAQGGSRPAGAWRRPEAHLKSESVSASDAKPGAQDRKGLA